MENLIYYSLKLSKIIYELCSNLEDWVCPILRPFAGIMTNSRVSADSSVNQISGLALTLISSLGEIIINVWLLNFVKLLVEPHTQLVWLNSR